MKIKTGNNSFYFLVLLLFSILIHFYAFGKPEQVVFDEVHFGKYVSAYCCNSQRIFDIHPPHGKILIAYTAKWLGYDGGQDFSKISNPFPKSANKALRLFPSIMGTLLVPIIFILMIQLNASSPAAFFAALLVLLDTALLTQSRFIFLDSILLASLFGCFVLIIKASQISFWANRLGLFFLAGMVAAIAVGTKFTGLVVFAMAFFYAVYDVIRQRSTQEGLKWLMAALVFIIGFVVIYLAGWKIHFNQLNQPGPGDIWGVLKGSFWEKLQHIHITMLKANANLTTPHHDASMWWSWPFMHKPIYYWNGSGEKVYLIGNPLVWWSSLLMMLTAWVTLALMRVTALSVIDNNSLTSDTTESSVEFKSRPNPQLWFPFLGFMAAFLPLVWVSRPLFLYHYFTPLLFSLLFVVLWLDKIAWFNPESVLRQRFSVYAYLLLTLAGFLVLSPLSYGLPHGIAVSDWIFNLLPGWR